MFFFAYSGNNGTGGGFSIQIPCAASCVWSGSAHVGRSSRVRLGAGGEQSEKPTCKHINRMSEGIKAVFGVFQAWKVVQKLRVPSPEGALLDGLGAGNWVLLSVKATKLFAKGWKVSQKVLTFKGQPAGSTIEKVVYEDLALLAKRFNTFYAAIKILQFTKGLGRQPQEVKLPDGDSIWKGYKVSKSLLTILDPVVGNNGWAFTDVGKGFSVLKTTVGGIGVVVKAALLSKELCIAVLQKLVISRGTFAASRQTGYQRNRIGMPVDRSYQSKPKRLSCMAITKEGDFCNLLAASFPCGLLSNDGLFSLIQLFTSFAEDTESSLVKFCDKFIICCLAIPLPSSEILVFV